jgi:site-specific recombinase XerD
MDSTTLPAPVTISTFDTMSEESRRFASKSRARRTVEGYRSDWSRFKLWCQGRNLRSLPTDPATIADYLTSATSGAQARKAGTIGRWLSAISSAHTAAGQPDPTKVPAVQLVWQGIRRTIGTAQVGKSPVLVDQLRRMVAPLSNAPLDLRDRALLLLGFAGMLRRSEIVALDVADLAESEEGIKVTIRRSKTDQEGQGQTIGIPRGLHPETCPVLAVRRWLELATITDGPVFRQVRRGGHVQMARITPQVVALVVKYRAEAVGLEPVTLAGHSLRAGLATSAARAGVADRSIQRQGRWTSPAMVGRYVREAELFRENAAAAVGL